MSDPYLDTRRLYAWPRDLAVTPLEALPPEPWLQDELLHPAAVQKLGAFFDAPAVTSVLQVSWVIPGFESQHQGSIFGLTVCLIYVWTA